MGIRSHVAKGIIVPDGRYVPHHMDVRSQEAADGLAAVEGSPLDGLNDGVVEVNTDFSSSWKKVGAFEMVGGAKVYSNPKVGWDDIAVVKPTIGRGCKFSRGVIIAGRVNLSDNVYAGEDTVFRGDEGGPFFVGTNSRFGKRNLLHGLETEHGGHNVETNLFEGPYGKRYSVYIGSDFKSGDDVLVHGPSKVGDNVEVGNRVCIFKGRLPDGCKVGDGATIMRFVRDNEFPNNVIPPNTFVG